MCGAPMWSDDDEQPLPIDRIYDTKKLLVDAKTGDIKVTPHVSTRSMSRKLEESQKQLSLQLRHFLTSIDKTKDFYANMAESLCSDESFAETRDTADCWNGQTIGEYTKAVVAASVNAQKYNPEVKFSSDLGVNHLSEKLRSIRQAILGVLSTPPESDMYLRDEEGSGSGYPTDSSRFPDDDDEAYGDVEGSGSGYSEIDTFKSRKKEEHVTEMVGPRDRKPVSSATKVSEQVTSCCLILVALVCRSLVSG
ncbi:hypothetical protein RUM44_003858 [Polyplax serrata]|uniref:Uncharacterized protein n=1 Tax=Polyplax serrata TaxID=468196 RepID=A0ABR1B169_POLSC